MRNNMNDPLEPSSVKSIIAAVLLSLALLLLTTQYIDSRVELRQVGRVELKSVTPQVYAEAIPSPIAPQAPPEPVQAPEPVKPVETPPPAPTPQPEPVKPKPKIVDQVGAKAFIYQKESGNHPCKINGGAVDCDYQGNKACGIGQALPCSKLRKDCNLADYACQDRWFTNYMKNRYGSWEKAKAFWLVNRWW
jgi:hypothetical protein